MSNQHEPVVLVAVGRLASGGWVGVDLFFVLSGSLVSGLLFREHQAHGRILAGRFLIRRGFKIHPAFWALILVTVVSGAPRGHPRPWPAVISELLFVQNYGPELWNHTWSLAVEKRFYFLLALLLVALARKGSRADPFRKVPIMFLFLASTCLAMRVLNGLAAPFSFETHLEPSHLRLDSLSFGVLLSYLALYQSEAFDQLSRRARTWLVGLGILALCPAFVFPMDTAPWIRSFGVSLPYLGSGMLLMGLHAFALPDNLAVRCLRRIGVYS